MTDLNNDVHELSIDQLDEVSGGKVHLDYLHLPGQPIDEFALAATYLGVQMGASVRGW